MSPEVRPQIAASLEDARRGQLVHVDDNGQIRRPEAARKQAVAVYALSGGLTAAGVMFAWATMPAAIPIYLLIGGRFLASARAVNALNQASVELSLGNAAKAKRLAGPVADGWYLPRRLRALGALRLAAAEAVAGNLEAALQLVRRARSALPARTIQYQMSFYFEISVLTALGRTKDARAVLVGRGNVPRGEMLLLAYWMAELHVCCAEGKHEFTVDELAPRMQKAMAMSAGGDLMLLCAWAYDYLGDAQQAEFLVREAATRDKTARMDVAMPALHKWLNSRTRVELSNDFVDPEV